jgi:hypothetical protein
MTSQCVGTLVLQGQESIDFVNSLIRPTQEEMQHFREVLSGIVKNIEIRDAENGFVAQVANLDLSFLDDISDTKIFDELFNVNIVAKNCFCESYFSNATEISEVTVDISEDNSYDCAFGDSYDNTYLSLAA